MVTRRKTNPLVFLLAALVVVATGWWQQRNAGVPPAGPAASPPPPATAAPAPSAVEASPPPGTSSPSRLNAIPATERPQLERTLQLIAQGGPFPHSKDGIVFQNREGKLPQRPRGYYHEYTVPTPGASNRGARRVVQGKDGDTWYSSDHYATFVRIDE
jgi:ribonuclease T1